MGYAIATEAAKKNAEVVLVSGPTCLPCPPGVQRVQVESAQQMYDAVHERVAGMAIFIAVAAVADYRPVAVAGQKIKKNADSMTIELEKTPDILASVAALKTGRPYTVGFAAETQNVLGYARGKLEKKQLDMIAANDVSDDRIGFASDDNQIYLLTPDDTIDLGRASKMALASAMLDEIAARINA